MAAATGRCACAWPRGFGRKASAKSALGVMRRMVRCRIRAANPWRRYHSYRGETGGRVHNLFKRDFDAGRPFAKLGTDVTESGVAGPRRTSRPYTTWPARRSSPGTCANTLTWTGRGACSPCSRNACPGRGADTALGHGMAVPAPMVAEGVRTAEHMPVDEPQGQLFGQRHDRAGVRTPEGRVPPRQGIRFVRLIQARAGRVHHVLEHQTTPGKTRGTHPGGVPEHVPRVLGMYPD